MQVAPPTLAAPDSTAPAPRRLVAATALRLSRIIALALVWAAAIVILGWILDVGLLKGMLPGLIWMKVNTALGFAIAGGGLIRMTRDRWGDRPRRRRQAALGALCAAAVFAIGSLTLLEHATGRDIGIDQALVADSRADGNPGAPGRMAPSAAPRLLATLRQSVETGDAKGVEETAHAIRGMVGNFGARSTSEAAAALEEMGRRGALTGAGAHVARLERGVNRLERELVRMSDVATA
jgi:HPt (histidine-containing phosphotransfer) domain-containing protein